jgi:hypothetical protein
LKTNHLATLPWIELKGGVFFIDSSALPSWPPRSRHIHEFQSFVCCGRVNVQKIGALPPFITSKFAPSEKKTG